MKRWLPLLPGIVSAVILISAFAMALISQPRSAPAAPVAAVVEKPPPVVCPPPASAPVVEAPKLTAYQQYLSKRARIEHALEQNPFLLKDDGLLAAYEKLHTELAKVDKKKGKKRVKAAEERFHEADVFERTKLLVEELDAKL